MEKVTILGANGRPIGQERQERSRDCMLLGNADGAYMNCTRESIQELQEKKQKQIRKYRDEHESDCRGVATDMIPIVIADFENPYDELYNLLLQAYNNTFAAWALLCNGRKRRREQERIIQELRKEQIAKDIACEFITSQGYTEEFRKFCEERTGNTSSESAQQYVFRPFI